MTSSGDVAEDDSADTTAEGRTARADADPIPPEPAPTATPAESPVEMPTPSGRPPDAQHEAEPEADTQQPPTGQGDAGMTAAGGASVEYPLQDNPLAGCTLCHVDVEDEFVGSVHFEEKTGCKTCHGPSEGHLADENNEVKPEEVFARKDVDRLCGRCHECSREVPAEPERTAEGQPKVCIDCHGPHDVKLAVKSP